MLREVADPALEAVARAALEEIGDGARLGLGSGRAASTFISRLGERVRGGLRVSGVPTSEASAALARAAGIVLVELDDGPPLDLTVDGADEVAPDLDLVKGFGGALVRERIVAAASRRQVILVGAEKLVPKLGTRGRIPIEVLPFALAPVKRRTRELGLAASLRLDPRDGSAYLTDNGNRILDLAPAAPLDGREARALDAALRAIPGVVGTGLFLGTAERVLVGHPDGRVETRRCVADR
jgi:ribose 5-phosphate isomerase A